jgi:hypothetical protein
MEYTSNGLAFQANTYRINTNEQIKLSIKGECREKTVRGCEQYTFFIPFAKKIIVHKSESSLYSA